jgi:heat-inducible transcriptional repressor
MAAGGGGDVDAAEHAGDFFQAIAAAQALDAALAVAADDLLAGPVVVVTLRSDLGEVGHAQHLALFTEGTQLLPDDFGHRAADPAVDLVEHHRRHGIEAERRHLDRQADPRQFAAGGDLAQRPRRLPGVGANQEFDLLAAGRVGSQVLDRLELDAEPATGHAELAHQLADCRAEPGCAVAAQCTEAIGGAGPVRLQTGQLLLQAVGAFAGALQPGQLRCQLVAARSQLFKRDAMLACKVMQAGKAALELGEPLRIEIELVAQALEPGNRLIELDLDRIEQLVDRPEPRLVLLQAGQLAAYLAQALRQRKRLVAGQAGQGEVAALDQRGGIRLPAVRAEQLFDVVDRQRFRLEFRQLVFEPDEPFADIAGAVEFAETAPHRGPFAGQTAHLGQRSGMVAEGIEQVELVAPRQQRLVFVLAVDFDQQLAERGELAEGRRAAVDPGPRAAIGAHHPAQLALAVLVEFLFGQPGRRRTAGFQREVSGQLGALGAVAHRGCVGAGAGQQQQGIDQQRLAGTGFAGDHAHPGGERQLDLLGDGEITDGERKQHGIGPERSRRTLAWGAAGANWRRWPPPHPRGTCQPAPQALSKVESNEPTPVPIPSLDVRSRNLLRALIAQYIRDGAPVGSRTLSKSAGLDISPATIRNVMADLEEFGLVATPHTSAGRVPTAQGYRLFVDSLLQVSAPAQGEVERLRQALPAGQSTQHLLSGASELLSAMTHFVGLVTVPKRQQFAFRHIDFVPLDGQRVLVILVFTDNEVQNRIISTPRQYGQAELEQVANYLNQHFAGLHMQQIRSRLLRELRETRSAMERLLSAAVELSESAFVDEPSPEDMLVAGQTRLMGVQDLSDLDRLRELFEAFSRKREIVQLLEGCIHAKGVRLFIGEESGMAPLDHCSVVTAPYGADGKVLGVLGVIGPTRMAYERVIPLVQATAQALGEALAEGDRRG